MTNNQKTLIKYQFKYLAEYEASLMILIVLAALIWRNYTPADFHNIFNMTIIVSPFIVFHGIDQDSFKLSLQYSLSRKFYINIILVSIVMNAVVLYGSFLIIGFILQNGHSTAQEIGHLLVLTRNHWPRIILEIIAASLAGNFTSALIYHQYRYWRIPAFVAVFAFFIILDENINKFTIVILGVSILLFSLLVVVCNQKRVLIKELTKK